MKCIQWAAVLPLIYLSSVQTVFADGFVTGLDSAGSPLSYLPMVVPTLLPSPLWKLPIYLSFRPLPSEASVRCPNPGNMTSAAAVPDTSQIHYTGKALILLYHNIDPTESDITISPQKFEAHLDALKANHYNVVSLEDLISFLEGTNDLPPNAVVLTFDDGYSSFYRYVYPDLRQRGITATDFVIVNDLGTHDGDFRFLDWSQLQEMNCSGFSFYSHSYNLHELQTGANGNQVSPLANRVYIDGTDNLETEEQYRTKVLADLMLSNVLLQQKLGKQLPILSFPHGEYNQELLDLAGSIGIHYFATTNEGINGPGDHLLRRVNAGMPYISGDVLIEKLAGYDDPRK
ncbi:polysaccharide deacetylase family protein [Paenibacillus cremeus]|nr:polysaccharide deacetylase family protein [Paenibacillus cremeus]